MPRSNDRDITFHCLYWTRAMFNKLTYVNRRRRYSVNRQNKDKG